MIRVHEPLPNDNVQPDLFLCALGYETRAVHAQALIGAGRINLAVAFPTSEAINYPANSAVLRAAGFKIADFASGEYFNVLNETLASLTAASTPHPCVYVDITSMSKPMIAGTIWALNRAAASCPLDVIFLYSPAKFHIPFDVESCIVVSEPVSPNFAGWSTKPEQGIATIIGLGFEGEQALGTNEYLEPSSTWLFMPTGFDSRFDKAVKSRNADLIAEVGAEKIFNYQLSAPVDCYLVLEGLVYGLLQSSRPVLIPLGPKVFALISILVAIRHSPHVAVWRISGERGTEPEDRIPNGKLVRIGVSFSN